MGAPSGAWNEEPRRWAWVAAMSAEVTGFCTGPIGLMYPGPYQNMGTSEVKSHGPTCGRPDPTKFGTFGSI
jgi:hypothetical protein